MDVPKKPLVGVIMGSRSDYDVMRHAVEILAALGVPHEVEVVSAHRTPDRLFEYADTATSRGLEVIIAGAGGAAHLPGMCAAKTQLPVLGVPVGNEHSMLRGLDALLAIGKAGAINAGLLACAILQGKYPALGVALGAYRVRQTQAVLGDSDPRLKAEG